MKKIYSYFLLNLAALGFLSAQETFQFIGSEVEPLDEGFYVGGATYRWGSSPQSPTEFLANGCPGETINGYVIDPEDYERRYQSTGTCEDNPDGICVSFDLHNETGMHNGWSFMNVMILPDCNHKFYDDEIQIEPQVSTGFVQLRPLLDTSAVSLQQSHIMSPYLRNVQSLVIEASADVSVRDSRQTPFFVEYSLDSGATFVQDFYIYSYVQTQSGTRLSYDDSDPDFAQMMDDSEDKNIIFRITTNYDDNDLKKDKGQIINIHKIEIVADSAFIDSEEPDPDPDPDPKDPLSTLNPDKDDITITNGIISAGGIELTVYTISGRFVGRGEAVRAQKGLYIITTDTGIRRKILIQ
ncbi:MAG: hypothetical protein ABJG41_16090 [Cyclobacteriaceae bacterium]